MSIEMGVVCDLSIASVSVLSVLSMSSLFLSLSSSLSVLSGVFSIRKGKSLNYLVGGVLLGFTLKHPPAFPIYRDMRHVKRYQELFENQIELTKEQIEWLDVCTREKWTLNPQTGLVDVDGGFYCPGQNLTDFKGVRFGVVTWDFNCSSNHLTTLEGAPQEVGGSFNCYSNKLTSLEGAPQEVGGGFNCYFNKLTSLEGAPQEVGGGFDCSHNSLTSLEGAPQSVGGDLDCSHNSLTSLEGAPQSVGEDLDSFNYNTVSGSVLEALYKKMQSGMSWPDAVASHWRYIKSEEDRILLAPSNPTLSPEDAKGYQALARLRKRII